MRSPRLGAKRRSRFKVQRSEGQWLAVELCADVDDVARVARVHSNHVTRDEARAQVAALARKELR